MVAFCSACYLLYFMCRFLTIFTNTIFLQPDGFRPYFGLVCEVICQVWFLINPILHIKLCCIE
jgi:hypothetical protein